MLLMIHPVNIANDRKRLLKKLREELGVINWKLNKTIMPHLLKRLELNGFKSFAQKTVLEFPPGITAIVGPNGSGKSNVVDAIRWLLGEREAKNLRGGKVEDLIFAGTPKRPRMGMAQASLHFENGNK